MWNTKQNIESSGKQGEQLLKWGGHSASLDKSKYNAEGNADGLRVATKSCNTQNYKYDNKLIWTTTEVPPWNGQ